ncbi:MAG: hypothetical protein UT32_C0005G0041 [Parcubacteria group bacterium GW2011_GWC2_39_14]|nr:MAG: hypothetical protein UT32_C0005G0041 [Parcubacteria group bacterium GW2011_GWC2_39_14]
MWDCFTSAQSGFAMTFGFGKKRAPSRRCEGAQVGLALRILPEMPGLRLVAAEKRFEVDDGDAEVAHGDVGVTARCRVGTDPGSDVADEGHVDTPTPLPDAVAQVELELGVLRPPLTERSLRHGEGSSAGDRDVEVVSVPDDGLGPRRIGRGAVDLADHVIGLDASVTLANRTKTALGVISALDTAVAHRGITPNALGQSHGTAPVRSHGRSVLCHVALVAVLLRSDHVYLTEVLAIHEVAPLAVRISLTRELLHWDTLAVLARRSLGTRQTVVTFVVDALASPEVAGAGAEAIGVDSALGVAAVVVVVTGTQDTGPVASRAVGIVRALYRVLASVDFDVYGEVPGVELARTARFAVRVLDQNTTTRVVAPGLHLAVIVVGAVRAVFLDVVVALGHPAEVRGTRILVVAVGRALADEILAPEDRVVLAFVAADAPETELPGQALVLLPSTAALLAQLQRSSRLSGRNTVVAEAGTEAVRVVLAGEHLGLSVEAKLVVLAGGAVAEILRAHVVVVAVGVDVTATWNRNVLALVHRICAHGIHHAHIDRAVVPVLANQIVDALPVFGNVVRADISIITVSSWSVVPAVSGLAMTHQTTDLASRIVVRKEPARIVSSANRRLRARIVVIRANIALIATTLSLEPHLAGSKDALVVPAGIVCTSAVGVVLALGLAGSIVALAVLALLPTGTLAALFGFI